MGVATSLLHKQSDLVYIRVLSFRDDFARNSFQLFLFYLTISNFHPNTTSSIQVKNLCRKHEHITGSWVYNNVSKLNNIYSTSLNSTFMDGSDHTYARASASITHANQCCDTDPPLLAFCNSENENIFSNGANDKGCCICRANNTLASDVKENEKWDWVPDHCYLLHFEAVPFCYLLGNRSILFIGDSMTLSTYDVLLDMITVGGGHCQSQLYYGKSFYLFFQTSKSNNGLDHYVRQFQPDIVIMNAGAHLTTIDELKLETIPMTLKMIKEIDQKYPMTKYFFRTQYAGHPHCLKYSKPLRSYDTRYVPDGNNNSAFNLPYNWHFFLTYDSDAIELTNNTRLGIINVSPYYLRADGHVGNKVVHGENKIDCLHYAMPGVLDLTARIIYQMLFTGEM